MTLNAQVLVSDAVAAFLQHTWFAAVADMPSIRRKLRFYGQTAVKTRPCDPEMTLVDKEASEFLCIKTPLLLREFSNQKNCQNPPEMLSPTRY